MSILKYLKEMLMTETVYGNVATVYHRTKSEDIVNLIKSDGFKFGGNVGWLYGPGVYTVYDLDSTIDNNFAIKNYGDYIIKNKLKVVDFLIFDPVEAKKVYGPNYKLQDQWELITNGKNVKNNDKIVSFLTSINDNPTKMTSDMVQSFISNMNMSDITPYINGLIFTGVHDGKVAIVFDRTLLTPMAVAKCGYDCVSPEFKKLSDVKNMKYNSKKKHIAINEPSDRIDNINDWMKWVDRQIDKGIDMSDHIIKEIIKFNYDPYNDEQLRIIDKYNTYLKQSGVLNNSSVLLDLLKQISGNDKFDAEISISVLEHLVELGAKADDKTLEYALNTKNPEIVDLILKTGVEPDFYSLILAMITENPEIVDLILKTGVEPVDPNDFVNPLNNAIKSKNLDIIKSLINAGAKPNSQTMDYAKKTDDSEIIDIIKRYTSKYNK